MLVKAGYEGYRAAQDNMGALAEVVENISNSNSLGFKKKRTTFIEGLNGEMLKYQARDFSQGVLRKTNEFFDLALKGPGFFEVELPNGQRAYTRSGRFKLNGEGELVTDEGYKIIPQIENSGESTGPVFVSSGESELGLDIKVTAPKLIIPINLTTEIQEDGTINGINEETGEKNKIGKINVVNFNNPQGLESIGKSIFIPTPSSGTPREIEVGPDVATKVKQGFLEFGNVSIGTEFFNLSNLKNIITAQLKALKVIDKVYENLHYTISRST